MKGSFLLLRMDEELVRAIAFALRKELIGSYSRKVATLHRGNYQLPVSIQWYPCVVLCSLRRSQYHMPQLEGSLSRVDPKLEA